MTTAHDISVLIGKTLRSVENLDNDSVRFAVDDTEVYSMHHSQDCCESVTIDDVIGDLQDLVGSPIVTAEEVVSEPPEPDPDGYRAESETWTFYKLATAKGYVTVRWYGSSNGYYSESVTFARVT